MKKIKRTISISVCCVLLLQAKAQETPVTKASFDNLNLSQPGLENVNKLVSNTQYDAAAKALLQYYRKKHINESVDDDTQDKTSKGTQETADKALLHYFQPHKGYDFFDYGKDINWQYWPVKDNEVRWQLHRVKWWQAMGIAYRNSGNEKYAKEWVFQFRDWVKRSRKKSCGPIFIRCKPDSTVGIYRPGVAAWFIGPGSPAKLLLDC